MNTEVYFQGREGAGPGRVSAVVCLRDKTFLQPTRRLDCYALVLISQGGGLFRSGGGPRRAVAAGDAFLLFPGVPHRYGPEKGGAWTEWYVLFEGPVFDLWSGGDPLNPEEPVYSFRPVEKWVRRIRELAADELTELQRVVRLEALLSDAAAWRDRCGDASSGDAHWLARAREELEIRLTDADAPRKAASAMGLSYQTFRKRFRDLAGVPPGAYRSGRVLEQAAHRLLTGTEPVKQIAEDAGFCDEFHFTRRFRDFHGVPPATYRRRFPQRREGEGEGS